MKLYKNIDGTTKGFFQIGGPDYAGFQKGVSNPEIVELLDATQTDLRHLGVLNHLQGITADGLAATQLDVQSFMPYINNSFDGSTPPGTFASSTFYMCHTSGGTYTAGRVYYGVGTATPLAVNPSFIKYIVTNNAITGSVSFEADWLYAWDGTSWEKKCGFSAAAAGKAYIAVTIGTSASYSSTSKVPAGAVITDVICDVTTVYSGGSNPTIAVEVDSNTIMGTTDNDTAYTNQYVVEDITAITTADTVTVTIGGTPTGGAGKVYVGFVTPLT